MIRAVLGGSFDPVHDGHLAMVRYLLGRRLADRVVVVPAGRSPFKPEPRADRTHRLAMLRLALGADPQVVIDPRELTRPAPSYTIDTLEELRTEDPAGTLRLVIGQDNVAGFSSWHRAQAILDLAELVVLARGGGRPPEPAGPGTVAAALRDQGLLPGPVIWAGDFDEPVSSREVRAMLAEPGVGSEGLPPEVAAYIRDHALYLP